MVAPLLAFQSGNAKYDTGKAFQSIWSAAMSSPAAKEVRIPGPTHPIAVTPNTNRITVTFGGRTIADTRRSLTLKEATLPAVHYIPREDADMQALELTDHTTYCPYKGDAAYYSIMAGGQSSKNAVWSYEEPHAAMAAIKGYLAFYPDRVDGIQEER
jgi:uncharacterized protein (DUF427 family)